jgi:SAM-dependent methyltransferase
MRRMRETFPGDIDTSFPGAANNPWRKRAKIATSRLRSAGVIRLRTALALAASVFLSTSVRAMEDVPFVTTPDNVTLAMLRLADVGAHDYVIDLGSGDGRIVIVAAKRFGARGLGVDIDPQLVRQSRENAARAGVGARAKFAVQDLFKTDLSPASVVTLYLLPEVNLALRPALLALKPGTRVVSHDWDMADWKPDRTLVVDAPDKKIGKEKSSRVHQWIVPAPVAGKWCGKADFKGTTLQLEQRFQEFQATVTGVKAQQSFDGRIKGAMLHSTPDTSQDIALRFDGNQLRITRARGGLTPLRGAAFARANGAACL